MLNDSNYFIWNKGDVYFLDKDKHFKTSEFVCHCTFSDCKEQRISKKIISKLVELRATINEPLTITSAFRCHKYQKQLADEGVNTVVASKSTHELGDAVDVKPTRMRIPDFYCFAKMYFKAIGTAKTFLHLDLRDDKERRWDY